MNKRLDTVNEAHGRWPGILVALGIDQDYLRNVHGPCPMCGGGKSADRWRFDDKLNGRWICNRCGSGDGFQLLQRLYGWDFAKAATEVDRVLGVGNIPVTGDQKPERTDADKRAAIRKLLTAPGTSPLSQGTPARAYLEHRCGNIEGYTADLRASRGIRHSPESPTLYPALLAIMRYPDGSGASVHRTYLTAEGRKADVDPVRKIMSGLPLAGSAVRLGPVMERLGIAEGIETAICASQLFQVPVWAAISAAGMEAWEPPAGVTNILICSDHDANFVGQSAAFNLARRLVLRGYGVEVVIPRQIGTDWADVWAERAA